MTDRVKTAVHGFDAADTAAAYERSRPSYPAEVVAYVVGHGHVAPGRRVLDLAAGTGKLTRLLIPSGASVMAVEPMAAMREQLEEAVPEAEVFDGTAEEIPVPSASIDVVTVAQAFHWFDAGVALAEIRRVLRSTGHLFLLWNMRNRRQDWVRRYGEVLTGPGMERPYDSFYDVDYGAVITQAGGFTPVEVWEQAWEQPFDEELLLARSESVSVVAALDEQRRSEVLDRVRDLARTHPDLAGRPWFGFPYVTRVWHCWAV